MLASFQIAFGGDTTPHHILKVLNGGLEIEVAGGIDFGTAADLQTLLDTTPTVRTIDLDNVGGRVAEAEHVRDLIAKRQLATYANARCASACTIAYIGGHPRYLGPRGQLGFHRYAFPGLTPAQDLNMNKKGEQSLISAGVSPDFAAKAFSTANSDVWFPDRATLLSAGVATQEVDGMSFAMATGGGSITRQTVEGALGRVGGIAALKRADPDAYSRMIDGYTASAEQGKSMQEVVAEARGPLLAAVAKFRPVAGDDIQLRVAALISEEARFLAADHPDACLAMLNGSVQKGTPFFMLLPADIQKRDTDLTAAIIESGSSQPSHLVYTERQAKEEVARLWSQIRAEGIDISAVARTPATVGDERSTCIAMGAFMAEVSTLPGHRAGGLMRYLASSH